MNRDEKESKTEEKGGDNEEKEVDDTEDRKKRLEKGDYVIQVHVIEARDLKPRDAGDTSDPVAEVTVMSVKKSTQIHQKLYNLQYIFSTYT